MRARSVTTAKRRTIVCARQEGGSRDDKPEFIAGQVHFITRAMPSRFRLNEIVDERGIALRELARLSGVTYPTVSSIYHNRAKGVVLSTLDKLAEALGVSVFDLIQPAPSRKRGKT